MTPTAVICATVGAACIIAAVWLLESARRHDRDLADREAWAKADAADRYTRFPQVGTRGYGELL